MSLARSLPAGLFLFAALVPLSAHGEPFEFTRIVQPALLGRGDVTAAHSTELRRPVTETERDGGGGGGGGGAGLGGRSAYDGVQHREYAYVGIAPWLVVGAEQTVQQTDIDAFELGRLAPEVRVPFRGIPALSDLPVDLSAFGGARLRLRDERRRGHSAVAGIGLDHEVGRLVLSTSVAYETAIEGELDEKGIRYGGAVGVRLGAGWTAAAETWGVLVWTEPDLFQQDHHLGPSLRLALGEHSWISTNVSGAIRERPHRGFVDVTWMTQLGLAF